MDLDNETLNVFDESTRRIHAVHFGREDRNSDKASQTRSEFMRRAGRDQEVTMICV